MRYANLGDSMGWQAWFPCSRVAKMGLSAPCWPLLPLLCSEGWLLDSAQQRSGTCYGCGARALGFTSQKPYSARYVEDAATDWIVYLAYWTQNLVPFDYLYDLDAAAQYFGFKLRRYGMDVGSVATTMAHDRGRLLMTRVQDVVPHWILVSRCCWHIDAVFPQAAV